MSDLLKLSTALPGDQEINGLDALGWETIDGKDVCGECFERRECAEKGHDWSEWISSYWPPEGAEEYRRCLRCGNGEETRTRRESDS